MYRDEFINHWQEANAELTSLLTGLMPRILLVIRFGLCSG